VDSLGLVEFARALIDIDSTTGREGDAGAWLLRALTDLGYRVVTQPVDAHRSNIVATAGAAPDVVLSTHIDCVPAFFPSSLDGGRLRGRGACDAKGILAAQVSAANRLRAEGMERVGLLFVVGEERGSEGATVANRSPIGSRYLVNGEPTGNRLGLATRGVWRAKLRAKGRAAHSSRPELGESAIDKLVDAIVWMRLLELPSDDALGPTFYTVGTIQGGVAPNVVSADAEAEVLFRSVGPAADVRAALAPIGRLVEIDDVLEVQPVRLHLVPGFETAVFPYTTDIPLLEAWGTPLLYGPGSIAVAHTADEHVEIGELEEAVEGYVRIVRALLS
jgi:acetylornithine deacetylase